MRYPILIRQTNRNTIIALCPLLRGFFVEANSPDEALNKLKEKFICYLHDSNIQFEILPVKEDKNRELGTRNWEVGTSGELT